MIRRSCRPASLAWLLALTLSGCLSARTPTGPLPELEAGQVQLSDYRPAHPYLVGADGMAVRTSFTMPGAAPGVRMELQDVIVPPSQTPIPLQLAGGAAVLVVQAGQGTALLDQKPLELRAGAAFPVPEGSTLSLQARGTPLELRLHLFTAE